MKVRELTIDPVQAAQAGNPEFLDAAGVYQQFCIRRSLLWRLLAERKIRAVSIRQRGSTRGKRLFEADSIRAFLRSNVDIEPENAGREAKVFERDPGRECG
jgi:hypothetical protein